jgi:hypothetical protein
MSVGAKMILINLAHSNCCERRRETSREARGKSNG